MLPRKNLTDRKIEKFQRIKKRAKSIKRKTKESRNLIYPLKKLEGKSISISLTCEAKRNKKKENTS